jgi:hypothetical protein
MSSVKHVIESLFKQLASAEPDQDVEAMALGGDILNHPSDKRYEDPRGGEYGFFVVTNISGGKKVTWFAGEEFAGEEAGGDEEVGGLYGYTCYVPNEDWDIFQSENFGNLLD